MGKNRHGVTAPTNPRNSITGVILAGGRAKRMGGRDKGLITVAGRPMVAYIIEALQPQVSNTLINANRNLVEYGAYDLPVVPDILGEFYGPLAGMASAIRNTETEYVLTVPCDSPLVPKILAERLFTALSEQQTDISVVHDGNRMQPMFALIRRCLLSDMLDYLDNGGRKIHTWCARHRLAQADFSVLPEAFLNVNTPEDRARIEQILKNGG